ncbi:TadE family type IV pilus minor pilin [Kibdelosporangium aridum]|uniref:TadE-like domain-containing protein n=1 Tax=Kibdelosporangium aridum TaxID=2030 RepID=A0A1W2DQD8_KIBAR|nr:TadE family type IV pilus minor pilin [Kibdelosporangium aridum]SMC99641.1 hypothetical protein SAMN05661093_03704 [Kibdelosporangium aridum]
MTVEAAIVLGVLMTVVSLIAAGFMAMGAHLRCVDAAREAARLVARGDDDRAPEAVDKIAPSGANLHVVTEGDQITVEVSYAPVGLLPDLAITGAAYAVAEPEAAE